MTLSSLPSATTDPAATPETTALLLATFADLYRQEVGREEDVNRSLPFFGTALGIVIAALAYAAGRLPKWPDLTSRPAQSLFVASAALLALAIVESACVLYFVARATGYRDSERIGPEAALLRRLNDLLAHHRAQGTPADDQDKLLFGAIRQILIGSYAVATPVNRTINRQRYRARASASAHLVRGLIWAFAATTVIFVADKLGDLPRVTQ